MSVSMPICNCGLIRQSKFGTERRGDVEICKSCGLPITLADSAAAAAAGIEVQVPMERVTTLQALPGHEVTAVLGLISDLSASSGLTATQKGNTALHAGLTELRRSASAMGANAILGLTSSAFAATGGITSAFGGDAVGVLLMGTAVVVAPVARA